MSQKTAKRIRRLEEDVRILKAGVCALKSDVNIHGRRLDDASKWAASIEKGRRKMSGDTYEKTAPAAHLDQIWVKSADCASETMEITAQRDAERRRTRQAERVASTWKTLAYAALVAAIIIEVIAILAVQAAGAETTPEPAVSVETPPDAKIVTATVQEEPENELIEAALLARAHVIEDCTVTYYDICVECCGKADGITATGAQATPGVTVAVDPSVIPLGSDVLVDYGDGEIHYYRADDVGAAVKGNRIDLCVSSHNEALQLGRRTATVYWVAQEEVTGNA